MRAVLDTNVSVSAFLSPGGAPHRILEALEGGAFTMVTSEALHSELEEVLARPRLRERSARNEAELQDFLVGLRDRATIVTPSFKLVVIDRDPTDNAVLEAAVEGRADFIVTGDRDLLDVGNYEGILIVTPAAFLAILAAEKKRTDA